MATRPKVKAKETVTTFSVEQPITQSFPIVGIGASAGGLAAIEAFFSGMPADITSTPTTKACSLN
jgi:two-component system CheB/CheR fusion protein